MTTVALPFLQPPKLIDEDYEQPDDDELGIGTSSGAGYRGLRGSRPMTIDSLLEEKVAFVPARSKDQEAPMPYKPINVKAPPPSPQVPNGHSTATSSPALAKALPSPATRPLAAPASPFFPPIPSSTTWPQSLAVGSGLNNAGNTCFLNSALQVLLHTAPLVRYFQENPHLAEKCIAHSKGQYCMMCSFRGLLQWSFYKQNRRPYEPTVITRNLKKVAQHLRVGRQEDAHEFLRFCIDGLQKSALVGKSPKLDQKIKETTFVHQIFGGRLRSRVVCSQCQHPSDTFDRILDLSLEIQHVSSIKEALRNFVKVDELRGANKYKCEKCKKLVVAKKNFTIEEAPMVLTIHLKRFTPTGRKISDSVNYYMSDSSVNPTYRLYGVVLHSGGGPNSGHYTAQVRDSRGNWHYMNDDSTNSIQGKLSTSKNAYVLFYCRERGDALANVIQGAMGNGGGGQQQRTVFVNRNGNGGGKRPRESIGEGERAGPSASSSSEPVAKKAFIGPQPPTPFLPSSKPPTANSNNNNNNNTFAFPHPEPTRPSPAVVSQNPFETSQYTSTTSAPSLPTPPPTSISVPAPAHFQPNQHLTPNSPPKLFHSNNRGENNHQLGNGNGNTKKLKIPSLGPFNKGVVKSMKKRNNMPQTIH